MSVENQKYDFTSKRIKAMRSNHLPLPFHNPILAAAFALGIAAALTACVGGNTLTPVESPTPPVQPTRQPTIPAKPAGIMTPTLAQAAANTPTLGQTAQASSNEGIDACSLITKSEAEAALGKPVGEPERQDFPMLYSCTYSASDLEKVDIVVIEYSDEQEAASSFQMEIDINSYPEISGIGDRALRSSPIMDISVLNRKYELSIDVVSDTGDQDAEFQVASELAKKALGRLP